MNGRIVRLLVAVEFARVFETAFPNRTKCFSVPDPL